MLTTKGIFLFLAQPGQMVKQVVGAGHGAAGGIHPQHYGLDVFIVPHPVDLPFGVTVSFCDNSRDANNGDLVVGVLLPGMEFLGQSFRGVKVVLEGIGLCKCVDKTQQETGPAQPREPARSGSTFADDNRLRQGVFRRSLARRVR
jgi:hypothetical protein